MIQDVRDTDPWYIKIMKKIDFFSFIPVPKDEAVSTRRSMVGSTIFIIIFLAYIIFDFVNFLLYNPPISQNSFTPIGDVEHDVPDVAINFV